MKDSLAPVVGIGSGGLLAVTAIAEFNSGDEMLGIVLLALAAVVAWLTLGITLYLEKRKDRMIVGENDE